MERLAALAKAISKITKDPSIVEEAQRKIHAQSPELEALLRSAKRRSAALASFPCFLQSYFAHYFSIASGPQQQELCCLIASLRDRRQRKARKYSRAISRGFGKSTIITLCGVLWLALRGDWKFVLLISATLAHAEGFLRKIADEAEGNELLAEDFPELRPARDSNGTTTAWNDRHLVFAGDFAILAKGFGNKIRGLRHKHHRPDAIVIDDPDEYSDVESHSAMQKRYRWLERSALKTGSVLFDLDIVIVYTTIAETCVGEHIYQHSKFCSFDRKKYKALEQLADGTEKSCWEAGAPTALLLEERQKDPLAFASERQNEPLPEGGQCFKGLIQTWSFARPASFAGWQLALGVDESLGHNEKSNPSAIVGVGMAPDGIIYELYSSIKIRRPDQIIADLLVILQLFAWQRCGVDTSGNQEHFLDRIQDAIKAHNFQSTEKILVPLVGLKDSLRKKVRIQTALQPLVAGGLLRLREDSEVLLAQLSSFPYGHIDGPDALEYAVRLLRYPQGGAHAIRAKQEAAFSRGGTSRRQFLRRRLRKLGIQSQDLDRVL